MAPCVPPSHCPCSDLRQIALRALILCAASAASFGILLPDAWAAPATTTTTLTVTSSGSGVSSVASGTVVTLTATVVSGSTPVNPGQVKFCDALAAHCEDSALLATAELSSAGKSTYKFRPAIGSHSYQAVFVGTNSYEKSASTSADLTVTPTEVYSTTTAIVSSGSPGDYSLTATVAAPGSRAFSPAGDVSFLDTSNGNALLGTATLGTAMPEENFTAGFAASVGSYAPSMASGDFNGDGILDLATAIYGNGIVTVLLGNGDGTFTEMSFPNFGGSPWGIAVGDFNGDGILDLAETVNSTLGTVILLLGKGDGTFAFKTYLHVGNNPLSLAVGDFNGDGNLDIATANTTDNTVTVLLGNGDGTFTTKSTPTVGNAPGSVAVGDFNGDGIPDLAVANGGDNTVSVLLGNGDGTFTTKATLTVSDGAGEVAVGDFNGDGIPDLAVPGNDSVAVLLGNGDGTFTLKSSLAVTGSVAVDDFNQDGIPDLVIVAYNTVTVLLGNGDGTFTTKTSTNVSGFNAVGAVGDFNGDGAPDLATLDGADGTMTALLNQLMGTATATLSHVSVSGTETHQVLASYPGDANHSSSISSTVPLLTTPVVTALQLSSSSNPSVDGNAITLSASLNPYSYGSLTTNGETVTFYNGGTSIGTGTLTSRVATLNISSLPAGTDTLTARYPGDGDFTPAISNSLAHMVLPTPVVTSLQLNYSSNPSLPGDAITLTATLNPTPRAA